MITKYFLFRAWLFFAAAMLIQVTMLPIIALDGIIPNLWIIVLFVFTISEGKMWGIVNAAFFGFVYDIVTGNLIGSSMFAATFAIYIGGLFLNEQRNERILKSFSFAWILLLVATIHSILVSLLTNLDIRSSIITLVFNQGLFPGLFTTAIGSFVLIYHSRRN